MLINVGFLSRIGAPFTQVVDKYWVRKTDGNLIKTNRDVRKTDGTLLNLVRYEIRLTDGSLLDVG